MYIGVAAHPGRRRQVRVATVLIVDDNADICRVMARLVRASGHDAQVASGGQEALDYLASNVPDMMILDVMMPRVDGLDVLRAVRKDPRTAETPVIMFTAAGEGQIRDDALRHGANGYWIKGSLDLRQLGDQLSRFLGPPN
jgi:CheY-like chemotaxis protein